MQRFILCGCSVADRLNREQSLDERLKNEFVLQQLVNLVSSLDLSDELARSVYSPSLDLYCVPLNHISFGLVLQRCWLGDRKGIHPGKTSAKMEEEK